MIEKVTIIEFTSQFMSKLNRQIKNMFLHYDEHCIVCNSLKICSKHVFVVMVTNHMSQCDTVYYVTLCPRSPEKWGGPLLQRILNE